MISTVFQIGLLRLWNNKQELVLAFVVPVLFFSIFAMIFGRGVGSGVAAIEIAIIDDDQTEMTREITRLLHQQSAFQFKLDTLATNDDWTLDALAKAALRSADTDVVIHLPQGLAADLQKRSATTIRLFGEGTNPVGRQIVSAVLTQIVAAASARQTPGGGSIDRENPRAAASASATSRTPEEHADSVFSTPNDHSPTDLLSIESADVFAENKHNPKVAMYAAGIAVMFLLFSATGAGGSLLDEHEAGTLDRLLSSRLTVNQLLAGKWLYITCLGCTQLTIMFSWAQLAFGVDLLGHLPGFAVMAAVTAAATASFALCLAAVCRTRSQLNGVSILVILTMSALGGSMVPRYIMSDEMQSWGRLTFNAWALDGFQKVFWHDLPVSALAAEVKVLLAMTVALACVASLASDRWTAS